MRADLRAIKKLPDLVCIGRVLNGQGRTAWRSFHFQIVGVPWLVQSFDDRAEISGADDDLVIVRNLRLPPGEITSVHLDCELPEIATVAAYSTSAMGSPFLLK